MWNCETKVDKVYSTPVIYQNLEIPSFCVLSALVIISRQYIDIMTRNGSFQFATEDYKKSTDCGHDGTPDNGQKTMNSGKTAAGVLHRLQPLLTSMNVRVSLSITAIIHCGQQASNVGWFCWWCAYTATRKSETAKEIKSFLSPLIISVKGKSWEKVV